MSKVILLKENGKVSEVEYTSELEKTLEDNNCHLCWDSCANVNPNVCPKICDKYKKYINRYDFITDGYQIVDGDGTIKSFVVSGCKKYEQEPPREKLTAKESERIRKLKENFRTLYFGADSIEDAYIIQESLEKRGLITNIRGKKYPDEVINKMKIRKRNR